MSKKVAFPVMSTTITGVLYIVAVLLVTLRIFLSPTIITDVSAYSMLHGLLGFLAAFILFWALISLSLHPSIEANFKTLFVAATILLIVSVLATNFNTVITIGKLV